MKSIGVVAVFLSILFCSVPSDAQWVQISHPPSSAGVFASIGNTLFAGTGDGVFRSTDAGDTWTSASTGLTDRAVRTLAVDGTTLLAGTSFGGVYLSTNDGERWTRADNGLPHVTVSALATSGGNLIAGTLGGGIFRSTDNGATWIASNAGMPGIVVGSLVVSDERVLAAAGGRVYLSTDHGVIWAAADLGLGNAYVTMLVVSGSIVIAMAPEEGLFLTADHGTTWSPMSTAATGSEIYSLAADSTCLLAETESGVYFSGNQGMSWHEVSDNLGTEILVALAISGPNAFGSAVLNTMWRRPLSDMTTGVQGSMGDMPRLCFLEQNYPNPFNPSTTIRYALPTRGHVTLTIYDLLGRVVKTLLDGDQEGGHRVVVWDASDVSSGTYLCRLTVHQEGGGETFSSVTRMILMR